MKRVVAVVAVLLALASLTPLGAAAQQPTLPEQQSRMRVEVESVTPRVVTAATPTVTVTGILTNTGDRRVDDIRVQLQRGSAVAADAQLREGLVPLTEPLARSPFVSAGDPLEPGQSRRIEIAVAVRGPEGTLQLDRPGVYPLMVNINGRPEFGGRARLATVSTLLPALSVPGNGGTPASPDGPGGVTLLWPLLDDHPRQVQPPGERPVLADDDLATSLAPGGRLFGLVNTVQQVTSADPELLDAICFAVDPDLLETVQQMALGYQVRYGNGQLAEGTGTEAAKAWLASLRALTAGQCVIAVPYADADLVALSRAGALQLEQLALTSAAVVADVLKPVQPLPGVLWPADGALDQRTLLDLAGTGTTTVLADPAFLRNREGGEPYAVSGPPPANPVHALPVDTLVSSFLDGTGAQDTGAGQGPLPVQNTVAALTYQLAFTGGRSVLIAPPRRWTAPAGELAALLQTLRQLFDTGLAEPRGLAGAGSAAPRGTASEFSYPSGATGVEIAGSVTGEAVRINTELRDLVDAMQLDDTAQVDPRTLVDPLRYGLLRATSTAWRGRGELAGRAVGEVATQLDALRGQVTVANPGRPLTLASGNSPIPVLISNALPVSVVVRIRLGETPGLRPEAIPDVVIPARLSVNRYLPAEVIRSGRFTVDVSLSTPGGTPLGSTARLELTSTTYGRITLMITGTAAVALFLLVGLRIVRRVRAARRTASENES